MTASEPNFLFYNALILSQENICKKTKQIRKLCNFLCNRNFSAKLRKYLKFALLGQYSQTFYMYSLRQPVNKLSTGITVKKSSLLGATEFYMYWEVWLKNKKNYSNSKFRKNQEVLIVVSGMGKLLLHSKSVPKENL